MESTEKDSFFSLMADVHAFYRQDISRFALGVWWEALKAFDYRAVKDAFNRHAVNPDNGQFCPKPADIVRLIAGGTQDAALIAWTRVQKAVREQGMYRSVNFEDPIINAVLKDMGGWVAIGQIREDKLPFRAKEFENRYRGYRQRGEVPMVGALLGIADGDNQTKGFALSAPAMVGRPVALIEGEAA